MFFSLFLVSQADAAQTEMDTAKKGIQKDPFRHHSFGIEYNFITLSDFGTSLAHLFDDQCDKLFECSYGAISVDYGYMFYNNIEVGIIANSALAEFPLISLMGKLKINGRSPEAFVNPFFEIDFGMAFMRKKFFPMGHITLLGLEIGYPVSVRFQIPFLLWGQRGLTYLGVGYRF
jgi:hypothetical protein